MKQVIRYIHFPFAFSSKQLQQEFSQLSHQWIRHYNEAHYEGDWSALPLRSLGGSLTDLLPEAREDKTFADTALMDTCPYMKQVINSFGCEVMGVRLLKLAPGAFIKEHKDAELCYEHGEARIHVPILTNDLVEFYIDGERVVMDEGSCWYMNFNLPHRISNGGTTDRVHLVMDLKVNGTLQKTFDAVPDERKKMTTLRDTFSRAEKESMIASLRALDTPTAVDMANRLEVELAKDQ
ncbi:MAG: aspartyl/asparaginyl beta-hydroxylase domain-containing protein [Flavipsychrobacter sp.]|nr:aspartyl/asparaginyl beta-hydroxylase domain-containing protein [Flavipsychrobacter sp.]